MRYIIMQTNIPSDDQYHFRQRAQALVTQWGQFIESSEDRCSYTLRDWLRKR